ncbi:DUF6157 family protein [Paenibacillus cremeus]|uniref:Uncharacterized protein n=1 Tax=Paenibacillus cremeus TaxID=2163881 RepID=A0A559KH71_9BACL|nr:DUF6157 family protein [Paenibacillus cremeus]TVY11479.1 hypothetical protein FPZ49_01915 [Paenibacillus cremeus]
MKVADTFVQVSPDCPVQSSVVPVSRTAKKPAHVIQYELLSRHPYQFTLDDLVYEVHIRHKEIPDEMVKGRADEIRAELFQKNHPCMRASMLPKKYGWGVHYDTEGRIAIYGMESPEYEQLIEQYKGTKNLVAGMRSSRA